MSLLDLWISDRKQIEGKTLQQIISWVGTGSLRDDADSSREFREFLSSIDSGLLADYAVQCLSSAFDGNGHALQDIVNQVGERLDFDVAYGRYRGVQGQSGHDGLWKLADGHSIIVEVKTSDFRFDLASLMRYRRLLSDEHKIDPEKCSFLIVVGRKDTGDLESQVRGSRLAWDTRILSVDGLFRLLGLKENLENPVVLKQIAGILIPQEFTRLDGIIDLVFATAEDTGAAPEDPSDNGEAKTGSKTKKFTPTWFHEECMQIVAKKLGVSWIKESRSQFRTPDRSSRVACLTSRKYESRGEGYWFAFHHHQFNWLAEATSAHVALGCGSTDLVFLVPFAAFRQWVDKMHTTVSESRDYWHVRVQRSGETYLLHRQKGAPKVDLTPYIISGR